MSGPELEAAAIARLKMQYGLNENTARHILAVEQLEAARGKVTTEDGETEEIVL
jgi:hypothetical protein